VVFGFALMFVGSWHMPPRGQAHRRSYPRHQITTFLSFRDSSCCVLRLYWLGDCQRIVYNTPHL